MIYPGFIGRMIFSFVVAFAGGNLGWLLGAFWCRVSFFGYEEALDGYNYIESLDHR